MSTEESQCDDVHPAVPESREAKGRSATAILDDLAPSYKKVLCNAMMLAAGQEHLAPDCDDYFEEAKELLMYFADYRIDEHNEKK